MRHCQIGLNLISESLWINSDDCMTPNLKMSCILHLRDCLSSEPFIAVCHRTRDYDPSMIAVRDMSLT